MPIKTLEGKSKYDNTVMKVRSMTNAKHAMTVILDGDRGSGYAIHIAGTTREERLLATREMVVALAQVAQGLMRQIGAFEGATEGQILTGTEPVEPFVLEPSPPRCEHCGGLLPEPPESPVVA